MSYENICISDAKRYIRDKITDSQQNIKKFVLILFSIMEITVISTLIILLIK